MPFQIANCNSFIVAVVDDILCVCVYVFLTVQVV